VQETLAAIRRDTEARLRRKISRAIKTGELPVHSDAALLAGLTMTVIQGLSTMARDGASRKKLLGVASHAMRAWPGVGMHPVKAGQRPDDEIDTVLRTGP
jgi:hypothetical protein